MTLDPHCSVTISSLSEPECPTNESPMTKSSNNFTEWVVVCSVSLVLIAILVIAVAALVTKNRRLTPKSTKRLARNS